MRLGFKRELETAFMMSFPNCNLVHLTTYPKLWRHCCGPGGLQVMNPLQYNYNGVLVLYTYCSYCNQITYYISG